LKHDTEAKEQPTIEQTRQELERISEHRSQLVSNRVSIARRLDVIEEENVERYLQGDSGGLEQESALTAELRVIEKALGVLAEHEKVAEIEVRRATARDIRRQAKEKASELEKLNQETAKLLVELSRLEGVPFTPSILSSQPVLGNRGVMADPLTTNAPDPWLGILELRVNNPSGELAHAPRSRGMRAEIRKLEAEAASIEQNLIPRATNHKTEA
jgi:hypothetical protein